MTQEAASIDSYLQEGILGQCLNLSNPERASLDLAELRRRPELAARAATALAKIVRRHEKIEEAGLRDRKVDVLVPATSGAAWLAKEAALQRGLWVLEPQQDPKTGALTISDATLKTFDKPQRIVIVEGAHDDKNLAAVLSVPWVAEQAVAVAALLHLDDPAAAKKGKLPIDAVIWEPKPAGVQAETYLKSAV